MNEPVPLRDILPGVVEELRAKIERLQRDVEALKAKPDTEAAVLDVKGAAAFLKVSEKTIQRRVKAGRIPWFRIGNAKNGKLRFIRADVLKAARAGFPKLGTPRLHSKRHAPSRPATGARA